MDRNGLMTAGDVTAPSTVALRKESVDRNVPVNVAMVPSEQSLSARRAWIEMEYTLYCPPFGEVALRKESVDRNHGSWSTWIASTPSLSARRAWIEILGVHDGRCYR